MTKANKKPIRVYSKKEPEVYHYFNAKGEKLWGFRHRFYDSVGDRREKAKQGLKSENIAIRALLEIKTDLINGDIKKVDNANLTVSEWLDHWFNTYKNDWKVTSLLQREDAIKNQMKPLLGKFKLSELDRSTYRRKYINVLLKKYEPGTVVLFHRLFITAINAAIDDEIISRNRFTKIKIDANDEAKKLNFLTVNELKTFLTSVKSLENITNYTATLLLAYTGLRKGELQGLQWSNIDFIEKTLTVDCTRDKYGDRPPKTKRSHRTILIDEIVMEQLGIYKKWCKKILFSFGMHLKDNDYVFISHQSGAPIGDNTLNACFHRVTTEITTKSITPHGLRHTHATILIGQRIPLKTIADRLGNTPEMVLKVYGHSYKELEEESVTVFGQVMTM